MMDAVNLISSVGFPIFVTLWFMFRVEKVMQANTSATENMSKLLEAHLFEKK